MDGSYIVTLHNSLLESSAGEVVKKKASLKYKAVVYLLAHVHAWPSLEARTSLLRVLSGITDSAKGTALLPILEQTVKQSMENRLAVSGTVESTIVEDYGKLLIQPYAFASKKWIESTETNALSLFEAAIQLEDETGVGSVVRIEALRILGSSLFVLLRGDNRVSMYKRLVKVAVTHSAVSFFFCVVPCEQTFLNNLSSSAHLERRRCVSQHLQGRFCDAYGCSQRPEAVARCNGRQGCQARSNFARWRRRLSARPFARTGRRTRDC